MNETRPVLSASLSGAELRRWYWTLEELSGLARTLGVPRGGGKQALTERLAAVLDGEPATPPPRRAPSRLAIASATSSAFEGQRR